MTPREKAEELINKFSKNLPWYNEKDNKYKSKQCAIIAVDEIIDSTPIYPSGDTNIIMATLEAKNFWQEVKKELESL